MSGYIAHDGENVWGFGESAEAALEDGKHWLSEYKRTMEEHYDVLLVTEQATQELIEHVDTFGGNRPPMVKTDRVWDLQERYKGL